MILRPTLLPLLVENFSTPARIYTPILHVALCGAVVSAKHASLLVVTKEME